jgi:hypothetical protein
MGDPIIPEESEKKKDAVRENRGAEKEEKKKKGRVLTGIGTIPR